MSQLPTQRVGLKPVDSETQAGITGMFGKPPVKPQAAPAGGIGVKQSTLDTAGHPQPGMAPSLPTFQPTVEAPKVPAPASAQVGVKNEAHPDNPVKAPVAKPAPAAAPANWQTGQPAQWPIQPMPAGAEPFYVAQARLDNKLAGGPSTFDGVDARAAERLGLYKQYHGGWAPGEYQQMQGQPGGIGVQAGGQPGADPYRQGLVEKMSHPGYDNRGGIAVYSGGAEEGSPSTADRNALSRVTAQNQLAAYDTSRANIRGIDGEVHNKNPNTAVQAAIGGLATPEGRALAEGQNQLPQGSIPVPANGGTPTTPYNAATVGPGDRVGANVQGLHNMLHSDIPLHQKVALAANIPGMGTPGSPHQELFDAWMARQQSTEEKWAHEVNQYGNTGQSAENGLADHGWLGRSLFGATGTGPNQARNQKFHADMGRLGYKFHAQ